MELLSPGQKVDSERYVGGPEKEFQVSSGSTKRRLEKKKSLVDPQLTFQREGVNDRRNPKKMWTLTACRTFSQELVSFLTAAHNIFFSRGGG